MGCGTGQATVPLAARGFAVTAVEPATEMAEIARRHLADCVSARVVVAAFEEWPLPPVGFDLVVAAASFHRLDPEVRMVKAAEALRARGALAVFSTHHIAGGSDEFFAQVQQCYERYYPNTEPGQRLPVSDEIPDDSEEFHRSARFSPPEFHRYEWKARYTTDQYLGLLMTYSGHREMPPSARDRLLDCIGERIDGDHGGVITKRYVTQLALAKRLG
ncbi:class I SAM-dependent methyltransferase [Saccharopolyspora aridisoli]|uniref:class I SAM-dependent methyltransferase n=1 Tax=Saccharopolyspora aridisoli TaxID=2530385 RepID=UPI0022A65ED6|nr:class I SAM-dependent methyltransferase [Saccharopolyspora aridisoli]